MTLDELTERLLVLQSGDPENKRKPVFFTTLFDMKISVDVVEDAHGRIVLTGKPL